MMLERQRRLNFLPERLFQATTKCDNSIAGPSKRTWGSGGEDLKIPHKLVKYNLSVTFYSVRFFRGHAWRKNP